MEFSDPREAGRALAVALDDYRQADDVIIIALAYGGVPVAVEVANALTLPLDVIFIRRLLLHGDTQSMLCAVNVAGNLVLDEGSPSASAVPATPVEYFVADALEELSQRVSSARGSRPSLNLSNKTVLVIDNGIRTGSTICAALRALGKLNASKVVVAVPVAAPESRQLIASLVDKLICLSWPEPFGHVGMFYKNFARPNEEEIREMLKTGRAVSE